MCVWDGNGEKGLVGYGIMLLENTRIGIPGVLRCCLETVATEYIGKEVNLGDKSACAYCKEPFTLIDKNGVPTWVPDWQTNAAKKQPKPDC